MDVLFKYIMDLFIEHLLTIKGFCGELEEEHFVSEDFVDS